MIKRELILLGIGVLTAQLMFGCQASPTQEKQSLTKERAGVVRIADIVADAERYQGEFVRVSGLFYGWSGRCSGTPPKTRSDWMLESDGSCIYVSGSTPKGKSARPPAKGIGEEVTIKGTVHISNGVPYIEIER